MKEEKKSCHSSEQKESSDSTRATDKSYDSFHQANDLINSIADRIESNQMDIQTKRLYKRYIARKQQDYERKKEVRAFGNWCNNNDTLDDIFFFYFYSYISVICIAVESHHTFRAPNKLHKEHGW